MASEQTNIYPTVASCLPLRRTVEKVACFLSRLVYNNQPVTLTGMSLLLDIKPAMVNESLMSLREMGAIELGHRQVVIKDKELLQSIAVPE